MDLIGNRIRWTATGSAGYAESVYRGYERIIEGIYIPAGTVERIPYNFSTTVDYDVTAKTSAYVSGGFGGTIFPGSSSRTNRIWLRDRNDYRAALGTTLALRPRWRLLIEATYGHSSYEGGGTRASDWDRFGGNVGFTSKLTERLNGTAKVGYEYWDRSLGTGDAITASVNLNYRLSDRVAVSLSYTRLARESVISSETYTGNTGGVGLQYQLGNRHPITLGLNGNFHFNEWDSGGEDTYATFGVSAGYGLREWWSVVLAYQFDIRDSSRQVGRNWTYTVNSITLSTVIGY